MPGEKTSIQDVNELEELLSEPTDGTIRALDAKASGIYNLGSGQARSFNELIFILNPAADLSGTPDSK
jgi:hypothetical protein